MQRQTITLAIGEIFKMAIYSLTKTTKTLLFASLLLLSGLLFFTPKHAAALGDNFPQGHSVNNEWVLLSQYQCPGHCLDTPKADIRIFYKTSAPNTTFEIDVQVDCRYVGKPGGSASLDGGTSRPNWPLVTCTGLNTSSGASEVQPFFVSKGNLNCSESSNSGKYPGYCFTDLHLKVDSNPGNQPIVGAWINTGDGLGGVKITALEEDNPGQNYANSDCYTGGGGCSPSGGPPLSDHLFTLWNNYANNGPDTHHNWDLTFAPDCTVKNNRTVYLRWYDADDAGSGNNGTQSGQISFDLHDDTANQYIFNNRGGLGGNDSYRDLGFTVKPGHQYTWRWNNVSATNGIQLWIPYSEIGSIINCPPPPGTPPPNQNPVVGSASCSATASTNNAFLGQSVTITVTYKNDSTSTDWWIGGIDGKDYDNDGTVDYGRNPANGTEPPGMPLGGSYKFAYPTSANSLGYPAILRDGKWETKQHSGVFLETGQAGPLNSPANTSRLGQGQTSFSYTYTVSNGNPAITSTTYHFGVRNDENGAFFSNSNGNSICDASVNWKSVELTQIPCKTTSVTDPGGVPYYLVFTDAVGNPIHNTSTDPGWPVSTNRDFDTYLDFPFLYPHGQYNIHIYQWGTNAELDEPVFEDTCMAAQCESNFTPDLEPGQAGSVTYGVSLANYTSRTYNGGEYGVKVDANPGLIGSGSAPIVLTANPNFVAYDVTFNIQALFGGSVTAHVLFGGASGASIDSQIRYSPCSPPYNPQTRPTLRVTNGDISTGGGFASNNSCSSNFANGKPRYISPTSAGGTPQAGGLRTFAVPQSFQGSGGDFAAYALGYITGIAAGNDGFYSAAAKTGGKTYSDLMFSNLTGNGTNLGGLLGGEFTAAHCTPDYFNDTRLTELTPKNAVNVNVGSYSADTQELLKINGPKPCISISGTMNPGVRLTIYTDEDVCIDGNITYSPWNIDTTNTTNEAPYLTIITRGNIYVQSNVSTITGLFIAQPEDDGINGGVFTSCANNASVAGPAFIAANCHGAFTVKGSVIAQHIYPTRVGNGTMFNNTGLAETFDYAPSAAVGQPYLKPLCGGAAVAQCEESNANLPPVF
jgi:hypothetical protein